MSLAVLFLAVNAIDVVPDHAFILGFVVVRRSQIEPVIDDRVLPLAVWACQPSSATRLRNTDLERRQIHTRPRPDRA